MTTRRSFFRSIAALTGAASVSPLIFLPKFEPVRCRNVHRFQFDPRNYYGTWQFVAGNDAALIFSECHGQ